MQNSDSEFAAKAPAARRFPLLIGLEGPPGGGKTYSGHRIAQGMRRANSGPVVVIDTEAGRASKYRNDFDFLTVDLEPPFKPSRFLRAVEANMHLKPAAFLIDSMSDEHEGEGGVLDWHDQAVDQFGGNQHAAWGPPKMDRKRMLRAFLRLTVPIIFTFRAREKTEQREKANGKKEVVNLGFMPVAPLEILHNCDLVCLLPNGANGVPQWRSDKAGEDFILKLPKYLQTCIREGQLSEDTGEALARWQAGEVDVEQQERDAAIAAIRSHLTEHFKTQDEKAGALGRTFGVRKWILVESMPLDELTAGLAKLRAEGQQQRSA